MKKRMMMMTLMIVIVPNDLKKFAKDFGVSICGQIPYPVPTGLGFVVVVLLLLSVVKLDKVS